MTLIQKLLEGLDNTGIYLSEETRRVLINNEKEFVKQFFEAGVAFQVDDYFGAYGSGNNNNYPSPNFEDFYKSIVK